MFRRTVLHPLFPLPRVGRRRLVGKGNLQVGDGVAKEVTMAVMVAWFTSSKRQNGNREAVTLTKYCSPACPTSLSRLILSKLSTIPSSPHIPAALPDSPILIPPSFRLWKREGESVREREAHRVGRCARVIIYPELESAARQDRGRYPPHKPLRVRFGEYYT